MQKYIKALSSAGRRRGQAAVSCPAREVRDGGGDVCEMTFLPLKFWSLVSSLGDLQRTLLTMSLCMDLV
ncbi:MAG: hypothetical protein O8C55_10270 [Candidatus Methanoperedens sp.]|nr:hypothetical protein [Candidatus Methanoperedens sp.]